MVAITLRALVLALCGVMTVEAFSKPIISPRSTAFPLLQSAPLSPDVRCMPGIPRQGCTVPQMSLLPAAGSSGLLALRGGLAMRSLSSVSPEVLFNTLFAALTVTCTIFVAASRGENRPYCHLPPGRISPLRVARSSQSILPLSFAAQSPPLSLFPYQSAPLSPRPLLKEVRRCKGHGCARPRGGGTRRRCEEAPGTAAP